jgi:hypothetical protein
MYIVTNKKLVGGEVHSSTFLCRSYREGGKLKKEVLSNLSDFSPKQIETIKMILKKEIPVYLEDKTNPTESGPRISHGPVLAVMTVLERLNLPEIIGPPSKKRDLVVAMICNRILSPVDKLVETRWWSDTTILDYLKLDVIGKDAFYGAMDWLYSRQEEIEKALATRHAHKGYPVFYNLSTSVVDGRCPSLSKIGLIRDQSSGECRLDYGILTDSVGRPIKIELFLGKELDNSAIQNILGGLWRNTDLNNVIIVGDRDNISKKSIEMFKGIDGVDWITDLSLSSFETLSETLDENTSLTWKSLKAEDGALEIVEPVGYPGERLIITSNPSLAKVRKVKREGALNDAQNRFERLRQRITTESLRGIGQISLEVGRILGKSKVDKYFIMQISDDGFIYKLDTDRINFEEELDGITIIRTSLDKKDISPENCLRQYEEAKQGGKEYSLNKMAWPKDFFDRGYNDNRLRAQYFIYMLADYVVWHMKDAWRGIIAADVCLPEIVSPTFGGTRKLQSDTQPNNYGKTTEDGEKYGNFREVLRKLESHCRSEMRLKLKEGKSISYQSLSKLTRAQSEALELLKNIRY